MAGRITNADDIKKLGTILSVWAHPDDETFLAAGIMATAIKNGQQVICVTATKGEAGSQNEAKWPSATLAEVRAKEMAAALQVVGIKQHHWLGYHDGECEQVSDSVAVRKLKKIIEKYQPDSILTFGPEGWTGHTDHATVSRWVDAAVSEIDTSPAIFHFIGTPEHFEKYLKPADKKLNIFFNIDKPPIISPEECDIYFELPPSVRKLKREALASMPSQTEVLLNLFEPKFLDEAFAVESYIKAN